MKKLRFAAPVLLISMILMALVLLPSCKTTQVTTTPVKKTDTISGLTLLTIEKMNEHQLTMDDLKQITLLIGPYENVTTLRRREVHHIDKIVNGVVLRTDSVKFDSVVIKPMTHGKIITDGIYRNGDTLFLSISFESGKDSSLFLTFKSSVNGDSKNGFILCTHTNSKGELRTYYGKKSYKVATTKTAPRLYFILDTKNKPDVNVRVASGRNIFGQSNQNPPVQQQTPPNQNPPVQQPPGNGNDDDQDD
jgi:hypothetical protein